MIDFGHNDSNHLENYTKLQIPQSQIVTNKSTTPQTSTPPPQKKTAKHAIKYKKFKKIKSTSTLQLPHTRDKCQPPRSSSLAQSIVVAAIRRKRKNRKQKNSRDRRRGLPKTPSRGLFCPLCRDGTAVPGREWQKGQKKKGGGRQNHPRSPRGPSLNVPHQDPATWPRIAV